MLAFLPSGGEALDIGAGTGRDAGALAKRGFRVTAVEPVAELRCGARRLHPPPDIDWIEDGLPALASIAGERDRYSLVMVTAVWMHLDSVERAAAMAVVAPLIALERLLSITLRRGPVLVGRRMFHVAPRGTIEQAAKNGLTCILDQDEPSIGEDNRVAGIRWRRMIFTRTTPA